MCVHKCDCVRLCMGAYYYNNGCACPRTLVYMWVHACVQNGQCTCSVYRCVCMSVSHYVCTPYLYYIHINQIRTSL